MCSYIFGEQSLHNHHPCEGPDAVCYALQGLQNAMLEHLRLHFNNEEASDEQVTRLETPMSYCTTVITHPSAAVPINDVFQASSSAARHGILIAPGSGCRCWASTRAQSGGASCATCTWTSCTNASSSPTASSSSWTPCWPAPASSCSCRRRASRRLLPRDCSGRHCCRILVCTVCKPSHHPLMMWVLISRQIVGSRSSAHSANACSPQPRAHHTA